MIPSPIRISVRAAPGAIAWHVPSVEAGEPFAEVKANRSTFHFPDVDADDPSPSLRAWMTEGVRGAVRRDGLKRWIIWPDQSVTSFIDADLTPHVKPPPSGVHRQQHE